MSTLIPTTILNQSPMKLLNLKGGCLKPMNNELKLVAEMLNNPSIITNIDIDSEWFET